MHIPLLSELDFSVVWRYRAALLEATSVTCALTLLSFAIGSFIAGFLVVIQYSSVKMVRFAVRAFIEFWRDTPLLVQALWVHFALPVVTGLNTSPITSGLIAISLNNSAYLAEIFRAGIKGVSEEQWEAAKALGLGRWPSWTRVIIPQAIKIVLPATTGFAISVLKGTAILSILAVTELLRVSTQINNVTFRPVEIFTFAAIVFLIIGLLIFSAGKKLESSFAWGGRS
jgi:polar amino acid transport system permease protein